jgi:1-acyl-sn-glycerol-3-phosphate acyltransferase
MSRVVTPFVYWFATYFTKFVLLPLYARITVRGLENVPMTGPLIIASNHLNDADPGVLCTRIHRRIVYMAKVELFKVPGLAQFMRAFGAFPVKRNEADLSALRRSSETLKAGMALCIFPEGTRAGSAEQLREAWPGAGLVALRNDALILPVAITGSGHLSLPFMFLRLWKRYEVTLTIGEPFRLPKPERINAEEAATGSRLIMERIAALLPKDRRGYYGSSAAAATPATGGSGRPET